MSENAEAPRPETQTIAAAAAVQAPPPAPAAAPPAAPKPAEGSRTAHRNLDLILDVRVPLTVHLGSAEMEIRDLIELGHGSIIALDKLAGEPVDIYVRGHLLAQGEVIVIDDNFGVRITTICSPELRVATMR